MSGSINNLNQQPEPVRPENTTAPQQIALDGTMDDWWLLKLPIEAVILAIVTVITVGQWAGDRIGEGIGWLQRTVEDYLRQNPPEQSLRNVYNGLRQIENELRQRGLPGVDQIDELQRLIRQPLQAKQEEEGADRDPAQDRQLGPGEIGALQEGGEDIHELKEHCPGGPSKCDLYKDREGNIYVKPKGGRGPGEPTGLNINDYLSRGALNLENGKPQVAQVPGTQPSAVTPTPNQPVASATTPQRSTVQPSDAALKYAQIENYLRTNLGIEPVQPHHIAAIVLDQSGGNTALATEIVRAGLSQQFRNDPATLTAVVSQAVQDGSQARLDQLAQGSTITRT
jgi:hypothetical protein